MSEYRAIRCPHSCGQDVPLSNIDTHILYRCERRCTGSSALVENTQKLMLVKMDQLLLNQTATKEPELAPELVKNGDGKGFEGDVAVLQRKLDDVRRQLEEANVENERLHCIIYGKSRESSIGEHRDQVRLEVQSAGYECGDYARVLLGDTFLHLKTTRGLNVVVLNRNDYSIMDTGSFDVYGDRSNSTKFTHFVEEQETLSIICIVLKDEGSRYLGESAKSTIVTLTGKETIHSLAHRVGYALIAIKGHPDFSIENMSTRGRAAHVRYILPLGGVKELLERGLPEVSTRKFSQEATEVTAAYRP